jgi:hypothetical protein
MQQILRRLDAALSGPDWAVIAKTNDTVALEKWTLFVDEHATATKEFEIDGKMHTVEFDRLRKIELWDPFRYKFWRPLKVENFRHCKAWQTSERKYFTLEDQRHYPGFRCVEDNRIVGFDFLNMAPDIDEPGTAMCADQIDDFGTFEYVYKDVFPALMINRLVAEHKSQHIHFTVIGSGYKLENDVVTVVQREFRHEKDSVVMEEEGVTEEEEELVIEEEGAEDIPEESNPFVAQDTEPIDFDIHAPRPVPYTTGPASDPLPEIDPEAVQKFREYSNATARIVLEEESMETAERIESIKRRAEANAGSKFETQESYIPDAKVDGFFARLMSSDAWRSAAQSIDTEARVRRICVCFTAKSHVMKVVWDRLIDGRRVVEHRLFVCSNVPPDEFWYKEEYRFQDINMCFLMAFRNALYSAGYIEKDGMPVNLYTDTAYRAIMRQVFLRDDKHGADMACNAFQMLSTLYLSMVENALVDVDAPRRFATWRMKRFIRFHLKCFQLHLRALAHNKIHKHAHMLWLSPAMQAPFVDFNDIRILCVDPGSGRHEELVYNDYYHGFAHKICRLTPRATR